MKTPRIALIHATPVAIDPICSAFKQLWPQARVTHLLDDSLASDLAAAGRIDETMIDRFGTLAQYAERCGADAVLFTCSAFGVAIEAARARVGIPVLKPNEAMLDEALASGSSSIGLLATFEPSIPSMVQELEDLARARNLRISIVPSAVPAALAALSLGRAAEHDRMIAAAAEQLHSCEVLVLSQFSMATAAALIPARAGRKVVTSPHSAVTKLRQMLHAG
jgi:Asp/Glu/hydantoin racemase